jgi:RNA polymerase sigma-70 factor (ECF subfamily)
MVCFENDSDAEEIVQESLLTVWRKAPQFNPATASAITWLYTIVRNKRIDLARKGKNHQIVSDDLYPEPTSQPLESNVESDLNGKLIRTLLSNLPDEQRQIVYMVYFEGKTHTEISGELDLPLGTIKSRLRLAMKKLDTLAQEQITWLIIILLTNF